MKGLLAVMAEPAPPDEEEFNAWYDTEHVPERLSIPGFISARRWVSQNPSDAGQGKYFATYELESVDVLATPGYVAHIGEHFSPWSKRVLTRCIVFRRWACEQLDPGDAPPEVGEALYVASGDAPEEHRDELVRWYREEHLPMLRRAPGVLGARLFVAHEGSPRYVALYDLAHSGATSTPAWQAALDTPWFRRIDELTANCEWMMRLYGAWRSSISPSF